ncbi:MAG TPA: hypothetical protein VJ256_05830, partial [Dehalococcoidia bacterium]|nr:hypothetical protein [Dehalococcoidia bacterium]
ACGCLPCLASGWVVLTAAECTSVHRYLPLFSLAVVVLTAASAAEGTGEEEGQHDSSDPRYPDSGPEIWSSEDTRRRPLR